MSILVINQAWTDNLGDIAIGEVLLRELSSMDPIAIPFAPITAKVSGGVLSKILNLYRLDIRYARWIRNRLKAMDTPIEAVVIGGGELLTANMNFNAALKAWMNVFYKRNIPVYIWGVGGGHTNLLYRIRYKAALKKAKAICVRDKKAKGIVKKCYGREAVLYPDLVFTYGMNTPGVSKQNEHKTVSCNVLSYRQYINGRGTYTKDEYFTAWEELINKEITPNATIIFGSTTEEDRVTTKEFAEYIKNPAEFRQDFFVYAIKKDRPEGGL